MFASLVRDRRGEAPVLEGVHRFHNAWERTRRFASGKGHEDVVEVYEAHERVVAGAQQDLIAQVYEAWKADVTARLTSLMIAADAHTRCRGRARGRAVPR